ncbi:14953_t:CDS:2 [Gigaspora rosea]|nr:14953_t:CDS:2 [Gigaspora rosea]
MAYQISAMKRVLLTNKILMMNEEITNDVEEIEKPQLIKLGKASAEIVTKIKYRLEFEEYLETSEVGVACIYNVTGMDPEKAFEIFDLKNIQYSYKDETTRESVYCPFLNANVYKETRTCRSIKMCQFVAPELLTITYTSVNFEDNLFKKIFNANELSLDTNTLKTVLIFIELFFIIVINIKNFIIISEFAVAHKTLYGFIRSRTRIQCDGKPKLEQHYQPNYFIGYEKFKMVNMVIGIKAYLDELIFSI